MTTIESLTKTRQLAIEASTVVSAAVVSNNLILTKRDGSTINTGNVRGANGSTGATGAAGWAATELGGADDLNTMFTSGLFSQTTDAEAASGSNYPVPYAGILQVFKNAASTLFWQTYRVYNSGPFAGATFTRTWISSAWSAWQYIGPPAGVWTDLTLPDANVVEYDAAGAGWRTPQYIVEGTKVRLRGLAKTLTARTAVFTIASLAAYPPVEAERFTTSVSQTWTTSASSAASSGGASAGTAHTHTIAHTHSTAIQIGTVDVSAAGLVTMTPTATNPVPINGYISLSGISWDTV